MKTTQNSVFLLLCLLSLTLSASPLSTNNICLDATLQKALGEIVVSFPSQIVKQEGLASNAYSSVRGESDYFLIQTPASVRLLALTPFTTSDFRPWYGVEEKNVTFTDVISKEVFAAPLVTPEERGSHTSTLTIDGRDFYIDIKYWATPRYPYVILTWGHSATYSDPGLEVDEFSCTVPLASDTPTNSIVELHTLQNEKGLFGCSLILSRPFHPKHTLQYSTTLDGTDWISVPRDNVLLDSAGTNLFYQSGLKEKLFFRLRLE